MRTNSPSNHLQTVYLTLHNQRGSVEHYFHFLLGYLVPLAVEYRRLHTEHFIGKIVVRSCALMDAHTKSLGLPNLNIVSKRRHAFRSLLAARLQFFNRSVKYATLQGLDQPDHYNIADFRAASDLIQSLLDTEIARANDELRKDAQSASPRVVLIDREPPHTFYNSKVSERSSAGAARRSIANFGALGKAVTEQYPNTLLVTLENKSLACQIALFSQADVIIAQHGAALANLIWCKPGTKVIEIHPEDLPDTTTSFDFFGNLASCMELDYRRVYQQHRHSDVDIVRVMKAIAEE